MAERLMQDNRTFAIVGHGKCGKTTLTDHILFKAGAVSRLGNVEDGTSVSDFNDEERERHVSILAAVLNCSHKGRRFNIIDTPGYTDFFGDTIAAYTAVDFALLVVDANGGVQVNTRKSWEYIVRHDLPAIIVVNKTDGEHVEPAEVVRKIRSSLTPKAMPVNFPNAPGGGFTAVVSLLDREAKIAKEAAEFRSGLFDAVIEGDEKLLERYLNEEKIATEELIPLLKQGIISRSVVPVLFTAAAKDVGIKELMDFVADFGVAPGEGPVPPIYKAAAGEGAEPEAVTYEVGPDKPFRGRVFKILSDPYVGKLCFIRVFAGTAKEGLPVNFIGSRKPVNLTQLLSIQGNTQQPVAVGIPGDIVAVAKIDDFKLGDTLAEGTAGLAYPALEFPLPMFSLAVFTIKRGDDQKIGQSLKAFATEDPLFRVEVSEETAEMVIKGMGNLHLESILSRLKKRFNIEVETKLPRIAYKETITGRADVSHKHKKQTGGHGQYGEVYIKMEPKERGKGFEFVDEVVGGTIPNQYIPAVEKGLIESLKKGALAGFPVVDVCVRLYFGSYHQVDSSEMAFKTAAAKAFKDGFLKARPVLLEPISEVEIMIPAQFMGGITGDINGRRGRMMGVDTAGDLQIIKATIPDAELLTYSTELRSVTGGEGTFTKRFSHYEVVPGEIAQKVIARYKKAEEEEKE